MSDWCQAEKPIEREVGPITSLVHCQAVIVSWERKRRKTFLSEILFIKISVYKLNTVLRCECLVFNKQNKAILHEDLQFFPPQMDRIGLLKIFF
ncbi:hypothetical protein TNIN_245841 [Trichonephila inaurata madagascariensis]|uniref:Uncharacterized protein n=1 Tax=Trichonephila inaurata madagascariensis TaxID=2747483 RepID=A0A8X7C5Y2_9ARAC|nr:hypothetical protein TNIN_245841 [Trichonephila inaurata madagascariensis]